MALCINRVELMALRRRGIVFATALTLHFAAARQKMQSLNRRARAALFENRLNQQSKRVMSRRVLSGIIAKLSLPSVTARAQVVAMRGNMANVMLAQ